MTSGLDGPTLGAAVRPSFAAGPDDPRRYDDEPIRSVQRKRQLLDLWLAERYAPCRTHYAADLVELERLVKECRKRGFSAVLPALPLKLEIVGDRLDTPRETFTMDCRKLAAKYQDPVVTFIDELDLPDTASYDLMHLVEPGRTPWQERLSREIVALLRED